ncbi:hypothetical protein [uncultured Gammaproteobacteria bacterium]|uniref:Uncharacterized protein n=2 Tax=Bathymodiolus azoricus thioautotrophic gill symbiont TaxID=235205 RepID=A0ACA8ZT65_9GAMM|nr:hypothetical protein AZO1586R_2332 [Bathymodiolus azoricus thioautotrophic gill symbiont]CAC9516930.1 hypothetical protein [uncultured Gammaproteobacteria bacterium]SEH94870.1 hypothetical protein BAZSYMB_SCAFFOLD00011_15 [Bathymodiolus azoricus thioautotrophic gill symbiont]
MPPKGLYAVNKNTTLCQFRNFLKAITFLYSLIIMQICKALL